MVAMSSCFLCEPMSIIDVDNNSDSHASDSTMVQLWSVTCIHYYAESTKVKRKVTYSVFRVYSCYMVPHLLCGLDDLLISCVCSTTCEYLNL